MKRKSSRTFVQILLFVLLLGTSSTAYADAIALTSASLSNLQFVSSSGTIMFLATPSSPLTAASAVAVNGLEESSNLTSSQTRSEASASVSGASAATVSDFTNSLFTANSNVILSNCVCSAESEGLAALRQNFIIVGGTGNVDVNVSALFSTMQILITDEFSLFAASDVRINLQVFDVPDFATLHSFSFDSRLSIQPPTDSTIIEIQRQLSEVFTLQFNTEYSIALSVVANSRAARNEIPEPASVVLLVSGLGFMAGFVRKRRKGGS